MLCCLGQRLVNSVHCELFIKYDDDTDTIWLSPWTSLNDGLLRSNGYQFTENERTYLSATQSETCSLDATGSGWVVRCAKLFGVYSTDTFQLGANLVGLTISHLKLFSWPYIKIS